MIHSKQNILLAFLIICIVTAFLFGCTKSATIQKCNPQQRIVISISGAKLMVIERVYGGQYLNSEEM